SRATLMQATPTLWQTLLAEGLEPDTALCLRAMTLLVGGEALPGELARALTKCGRALINLYGPTETTIWSAASALASDELAITDESGTVPAPPIGRPIGNTRVYVLDSCLAPVPAGVAGELYVAGS